MTEHADAAALEAACRTCVEAMLPTDQQQLEANLLGLQAALARYSHEALVEVIVGLACVAAEQYTALAAEECPPAAGNSQADKECPQ